MDRMPLPRSARGPRPVAFPAEPGAERVLNMVLALATEVAVLRERLDTVERLAADRGLVLPADIEAYEPSLEVREERAAWRRDYLERVLRVLTDEAAP